MFRPELLLVHEPVAACEARLRTEGYDAVAAGEIASYLAQSTDLATEFDALRDACAAGPRAGLDAHRRHRLFPRRRRLRRWRASPAIAPSARTIRSSRSARTSSAPARCCARSDCRCRRRAVPRRRLARAPRRDRPRGHFVKPNRLGAKIGIWPDSRATTSSITRSGASRRIFDRLSRRRVVQPYVPGRNVRASFPRGRTRQAGIDRSASSSSSPAATSRPWPTAWRSTATPARRPRRRAYAEPELERSPTRSRRRTGDPRRSRRR
jgi:hypothetical protein